MTTTANPPLAWRDAELVTYYWKPWCSAGIKCHPLTRSTPSPSSPLARPRTPVLEKAVGLGSPDKDRTNAFSRNGPNFASSASIPAPSFRDVTVAAAAAAAKKNTRQFDNKDGVT